MHDACRVAEREGGTDRETRSIGGDRDQESAAVASITRARHEHVGALGGGDPGHDAVEAIRARCGLAGNEGLRSVPCEAVNCEMPTVVNSGPRPAAHRAEPLPGNGPVGGSRTAGGRPRRAEKG